MRVSLFSLAMLDIDYFKQINDNFGHNIGDLTLKNVAAVIYDHIRSSDYMFRYGGEEFMILLVESDESQASIILETLRMENCWDAHGSLCDRNVFQLPSVSAVLPNMIIIPTTNSWLIKPIGALYLAKSNGRDRVEVYQE